MKVLIVLFLSGLFLTSCASHKKLSNIAFEDMDGLRFESLNRYNNKRLEEIKTSEKNIAACHRNLYTEALTTFKKSLDKEKNNPKYWNKIATCYLLKEELSKAKFYYDLALQASGKNKKMKATINNNIGIYFNLLKKDQIAISFFEKATQLNNKMLTPKFNLSQVYLRFGLYQKAQKILKQLIIKAPKDIDFIASLGHLSLMTGKYKKAKWYYSQIPLEYITRDDYATNYAMVLFMLGDFNQAKKIISNAQGSNAHYSITQTKILKKIKNESK